MVVIMTQHHHLAYLQLATRKQLVDCETEEAQYTIIESAETPESDALLTKIRVVDFVAK